MKTLFITILSVVGLFKGYAAELFIQTEFPSLYTITVENQTITNKTGKFRFFDLTHGAKTIYLFNAQTNDLILTNTISLTKDTRTIIFITIMGTVMIKHTYPIIATDWYNSFINTDHQTQNTALNRSFEDFIKELKNTHTDQRKLDMANDYIANTYLTADNVGTLLGVFDFDTYRVKFAINAYHRIIDPTNYYTWRDKFDFNANYIKVENTIKAKR